MFQKAASWGCTFRFEIRVAHIGIGPSISEGTIPSSSCAVQKNPFKQDCGISKTRSASNLYIQYASCVCASDFVLSRWPKEETLRRIHLNYRLLYLKACVGVCLCWQRVCWRVGTATRTQDIVLPRQLDDAQSLELELVSRLICIALSPSLSLSTLPEDGPLGRPHDGSSGCFRLPPAADPLEFDSLGHGKQA